MLVRDGHGIILQSQGHPLSITKIPYSLKFRHKKAYPTWLRYGDGSKPSDSKKTSSATVAESSTRAHSRRLLIKELPISFTNI